jgi:signal transduction histidine kinase
MQNAADLLNLTSEAAVLVRAGRAAAANLPAKELLGADCVGKTVAALFGEAAAGMQGSSFLAQLQIRDQPCVARVIRREKEQLFFLRRMEPVPSILNQPFLYALRSSLMNMELAADRIRTEAEAFGSPSLLESLRGITRSQFRIQRILQNASVILNDAENAVFCTPRSFSLRALCRSVVDAVQELLPQIRFSFHADGEMLLSADPDLIKALLMNLLSNAILHAEGCTRVSLSLLDAGANLVLALDDDGCGIPAEELYRVFDRYRHGFDLQQMNGGPGLGLTAAQAIARLHGGTLLLESRPGRGTTLRVSLRCDRSLKASETDSQAELCTSRELLQGLADCLPEDAFSERYLD